ncbi:hypothetical protein PJL18_03172 [Paenarthrobacter nicotinovorans]|nr:hypothetical protein [Paenarthrobacter nicotinovorans]
MAFSAEANETRLAERYRVMAASSAPRPFKGREPVMKSVARAPARAAVDCSASLRFSSGLVRWCMTSSITGVARRTASPKGTEISSNVTAEVTSPATAARPPLISQESPATLSASEDAMATISPGARRLAMPRG